MVEKWGEGRLCNTAGRSMPLPGVKSARWPISPRHPRGFVASARLCPAIRPTRRHADGYWPGEVPVDSRRRARNGAATAAQVGPGPRAAAVRPGEGANRKRRIDGWQDLRPAPFRMGYRRISVVSEAALRSTSASSTSPFQFSSEFNSAMLPITRSGRYAKRGNCSKRVPPESTSMVR